MCAAGCPYLLLRADLQRVALLCRRGSVEAARELLDQGADVNTENARGSTPLHFAAAAKARTREVCQLLLDAGADTGLPDLQGRLPYECAESDEIRWAGGGGWGAWGRQQQARQVWWLVLAGWGRVRRERWVLLCPAAPPPSLSYKT